MTGLLGSTVLEVAIGVAFVYLLLAIFCTTANEYIAGVLQTRGKLLQQGILRILSPDQTAPQAAAQDPMVTKFYSHPLIKALMRDGSHPSYISARNFAKTIMDLATPGKPGSITFADLENGIKNDLPKDSTLQKTLLAVIQSTDHEIADAQKAIEAWYDDAMDRVSGWYKRRTQLWILILAALVTITTNADTLHVARRLWLEPSLRSQFIEEAKTVPQPQPPTTAPQSGTPQQANAASQKAVDTLGLILGWQDLGDNTLLNWFQRVAGWCLTILAVSLGAPFWFDLLNKFMNLRSAGRSPEEKGKPPDKPRAPVVTA